jgi:hypothetical protein
MTACSFNTASQPVKPLATGNTKQVLAVGVPKFPEPEPRPTRVVIASKKGDLDQTEANEARTNYSETALA